MAAIQHSTRPEDFRAFRTRLHLYFCSSMASQNHPSGKVLQTAARVALLGLVINVGLATAKIVAGFIGHAYVLIADGIESALDVGGSIVIWGGLTVAARPPDTTHPYGHGKAEPIVAVAVALGVLAAALVIAIQSVREILLPHHGPAPWTLVVNRGGDYQGGVISVRHPV